MKSKKSIATVFFASLCPLFLGAQTTSDALNISQSFNNGTARFSSMGGAFGALGGDFSSIGINPAGLGVYRSSEFTFTPSFKKRNVSSDYNGNNETDYRNRLGIDNIGFVFSYKPNGESETGLINFNFAIGYNRANDFYTNSLAKGNNSKNSIMDYFAGNAFGYSINKLTIPDPIADPTNEYNPYLSNEGIPWGAIMAWNTYLINPTPTPDMYEAALNSGDGVIQTNKSSIKGSSGDYNLSLGANFSNKLLLGISFGIASFKYNSSITYSEDAFNTNDTIYNGDRFNYLDYYQSYETIGSGYNLKIGAIYKPIEGLRLGLSLHTPTYYKLEDTYSYSMFTSFKDGTSSTDTPNSRYDYSFETPLKVIGSIAYVFQNYGLLSFDIEHINYSTMRFNDGGDGYDFAPENELIKNTFKSVNNIKLGGEIKVDNFSFRGGYSFYPSPYKNNELNSNSKRSIISSGVGYRAGNIYIDAAYQYSIQKGKYVLYDLYNENYDIITNPIETKTTEGKFMLTIGVKF